MISLNACHVNIEETTFGNNSIPHKRKTRNGITFFLNGNSRELDIMNFNFRTH